jgi:beta-lactam-binding protein with PASTA domain
VPDVRGLQPRDAEDQLRSLGFRRVMSVSERVDDEADDNRVIKQSVAPGTSAAPDDQIVLTFGNFPGGIFGN